MLAGIRGPFGSAWPITACLGPQASPPSFLIVAGGIGLAPLRPAIYALLERRQEVDQVGVLVGARTPADLLYESEFDRWRAQGIDVQVTVDRPNAAWQGKIGVVTALLDRWPMNNPGRTMVLSARRRKASLRTTALVLSTAKFRTSSFPVYRQSQRAPSRPR